MGTPVLLMALPFAFINEGYIMKTKFHTAILCGVALILTTLLSLGVDDCVRADFEGKYRDWKEWVKNHLYSSDYTQNKEYQGIINLGPSAVPLLIEKIEKNPEDFHLEFAIFRITKRRFGKEEWPEGTLGDSITASQMYVKWWKEGRFKTGVWFAELYGKWKSLKAEKKDKEAEEIYQRIVDLGIPVLPYLLEKIEQQTEFVPAISKLSDGAVSQEAKAVDCKNWWNKNKQKFELPGQSVPKQTSDNK
jgi:hypothetical protein